LFAPFSPSKSKEDRKNGLVPEDFPGVLIITDKNVHESYRKFKGEENDEEIHPEFRYFYERLLCHVCKRRTKFRARKTRATLCDIYTPSDEAFGLVILENCFDNWNQNYENYNKGMKGKALRGIENKFCSSESGIGWNLKGLMTYVKVKQQVQVLRQTPISRRLEEVIRNSYSGGSSDIGKADDSDDGAEEIRELERYMRQFGKDATGRPLPDGLTVVVQNEN
jgi:hypothetical protein